MEAAAKIAGGLPKLQQQVFECIKKRVRATDEEICDALSMNPSTERPRRVELTERGLVRDSGYTSWTKAKRRSVLWEVVR